MRLRGGSRVTLETVKTGPCLSIRQPWAWLIVQGIKPVENRGWSTAVRGWVGLHAGRTFDEAGYEFVRSEFPEITMPAVEEFQRGGIIGRARLIDCVQVHPSPWFIGPIGFVFEEPEPLPFQPCRGMLGFFRPESTTHTQRYGRS